jgi:hypothetical protein
MTNEQFAEVIEATKAKIDLLGATKGIDYAEASDRLYNFREEAREAGVSDFQVWSIYFGKHANAIRKAIRRCPTDPASTKKGEPLTENVYDVVMYGILLLGLLADVKQNENHTKDVDRSSPSIRGSEV